MVTRLGFGRDAMNRVTNHKEGGIADVYDRHQYAEEDRRIMETVAARILALGEGRSLGDNVVAMAEVNFHQGLILVIFRPIKIVRFDQSAVDPGGGQRPPGGD